MKSITEIMGACIGRAIRAHAESRNDNLPKDQQTFHAGRREAYLQMVALICDSEVRDIRADVLGRTAAKESVTRTTDTIQTPTGRIRYNVRYPDFEL